MLVTADKSSAIALWCPPLHGRALPLASGQLADSVLPLATVNDTELEQAGNIVQQWPAWRVSRFNQYRDASGDVDCSAAINTDYVLVIWQQEISHQAKVELITQANQYAEQISSNILLVDEADGALVDNQEIERYRTAVSQPIISLTKPVHHAVLLKNAAAVFTLSSWLGFEALLWQRPVYALQSSFYQHLGQNCAGVTTTSLLRLVYQVFYQHLNWVNPDNGESWQPEHALSWLALQRKNRQAFASTLYAIGFRRYWRRTVELFFQGSHITFVPSAAQVPAGGTAIIWGNRPLSVPDTVRLIRLEDGFLRSVGLGALFVRPLSWVADSRGMYFDARQSSDLEYCLNQQAFSSQMLRRAEQLITALKQSGVSKYNTGVAAWQRPQQASQCILVAGQVETDASIAYGAVSIRQNIELLKAVRLANPDAYIIYKPHPDVVAGARKAGQQENTALQFCDEQVLHTDINTLLQQVDEVHVLTSLAGFEALVRGKKVVCYGLPFYAGWGLTHDIHSCPRRQRQLTLAQLVAGALLSYPLYISRHSGYYHSAEQTLADLMLWRQQAKKPHWLKHILISGIRKIVGIK